MCEHQGCTVGKRPPATWQWKEAPHWVGHSPGLHRMPGSWPAEMFRAEGGHFYSCVSARLTPSWLTSGRFLLFLSWITINLKTKPLPSCHVKLSQALRDWALPHPPVFKRKPQVLCQLTTHLLIPKQIDSPACVLQFRHRHWKMLPSNHKSSIQAAQIFASFLHTPPIKAK